MHMRKRITDAYYIEFESHMHMYHDLDPLMGYNVKLLVHRELLSTFN